VRISRIMALLAPLLLLLASASASWQLDLSPARCVSAIMIEPTSGLILYEKDPVLPRAPASIAKLMLELVVLERVDSGEIRLDEPIRVSAWASKIGGSQVYLAEGEAFTLEELLKAVVISSANDACVAVAEHVAGSAEGFVDLMNARARELGLANTSYINVHGLDDEPGQGNVTTARDIAAIARHLVEMSHVLEWSSIEEDYFRGGTFKLDNTNKLLGQYQGLDGLKTGYTRKAGFCLCATAQRGGMRLITVVLGAESNRLRFQESARLLSAGFSQLRKSVLLAGGQPVPGGVPIMGGRKTRVEAVAAAPLAVVLPRRVDPPRTVLVPARGLRAPIQRGDTVGVVEARLEEGGVVSVPVVAAAEVKRATIFQTIARALGGGRS